MKAAAIRDTKQVVSRGPRLLRLAETSKSGTNTPFLPNTEKQRAMNTVGRVTWYGTRYSCQLCILHNMTHLFDPGMSKRYVPLRYIEFFNAIRPIRYSLHPSLKRTWTWRLPTKIFNSNQNEEETHGFQNAPPKRLETGNMKHAFPVSRFVSH